VTRLVEMGMWVERDDSVCVGNGRMEEKRCAKRRVAPGRKLNGDLPIRRRADHQ